MAERVVSLRMGGFPRRSHGSPSLRVSLNSVLLTLEKLLGKQNKAMLAFNTANHQEQAEGKYSDCGRADYVVRGICIF